MFSFYLHDKEWNDGVSLGHDSRQNWVTALVECVEHESDQGHHAHHAHLAHVVEVEGKFPLGHRLQAEAPE